MIRGLIVLGHARPCGDHHDDDVRVVKEQLARGVRHLGQPAPPKCCIRGARAEPHAHRVRQTFGGVRDRGHARIRTVRATRSDAESR
jgi:hypothetical protein